MGGLWRCFTHISPKFTIKISIFINMCKFFSTQLNYQNLTKFPLIYAIYHWWAHKVWSFRLCIIFLVEIAIFGYPISNFRTSPSCCQSCRRRTFSSLLQEVLPLISPAYRFFKSLNLYHGFRSSLSAQATLLPASILLKQDVGQLVSGSPLVCKGNFGTAVHGKVAVFCGRWPPRSGRKVG